MQAISFVFPALAWTVASGTLLTVGDILFRVWMQERWPLGFALVFLIYMTGIFCMMMTFFQQNIAVATVAAVLTNVITYVVAAHVIYGDTISIPQLVGLVLGLSAIVILELS